MSEPSRAARPEAPSPSDGPLLQIGLALAGAAALAAVVISGWVSDDAFITLRLVAHLLAGEGPTWNPGDRVQVFTHPLWAALLIPTLAVLRSGWWAALSLGVVATTGVVLALGRRATVGALLALLLLAGSRSFVDFSTSGLENPLLHLLLLGLILWRRAEDPGVAGLLGGLALLTRLDSAPLVVPLLLWRVLARPGGRGAMRAGLGLLGPQALWFAVSLLWFGALLPNPALAKLGAGIPRADLVSEGLMYFASSARFDPTAVVLLGTGLAVGLVRREARWGALGIGLHLGYLLLAGGDFMAGRFLTPSLVVAAGLLARCELPRIAAPIGAVAALVVAGLAPVPTWSSPLTKTGGEPRSFIDEHGVADERRYYTPGSALAGWRPGVDLPQHPFRERGEQGSWERAEVVTGVGMTGFFGPDLRIVDPTGVTDPFLARLPSRDDARRPGHYYRTRPFGYRDWFDEPTCGLRSWEDAELCDDVRLVTRGALNAPGRWPAVGRLLRGDLRQVVGLPRR